MKLLLASLLVFIPFTVHAEYLGNLSANEFDPNSIANPFGAGSPFSPNSVTNEFGVYGNPFSNQSATNPYATEAPRLYDQQGNYRGELSTNQYDPDSVSNLYGRYGSPFSPDSMNNQFGAGNPYRSDSPNNPYGRGWHIEGRAGPAIVIPPPGQRAPVFLPPPSHAPAIIPFAPWGGAQWDYDMDASLDREEALMHMRMGELMRMQAQEDRDEAASVDRSAQRAALKMEGDAIIAASNRRPSPEQSARLLEIIAETLELMDGQEEARFMDRLQGREAHRSLKRLQRPFESVPKPARDLEQEHRLQLQREALISARHALTDVGLTQPRHLNLLLGEVAERRQTDPEMFARWTSTTTPAQQFKELAQEVLTIVCAVGPQAGCPTAH